MVDGGVCDALPIRKSEADGNSRNVIVLTRNKGYRKPVKQQKLPGFVFRKYPELRRELMLRYQRYNETIEYIEQLEADGKALVIRPIRDVVVDRIERDVDKLTSFYEEGYACAKAAFEKK
jgi:predicted patatin/cPLA2 family phospholipase